MEQQAEGQGKAVGRFIGLIGEQSIVDYCETACQLQDNCQKIVFTNCASTPTLNFAPGFVLRAEICCALRLHDMCCAFRRVAKIWKREGLFWKSEKCANDHDWNFHWSRSSFRRFVRKFETKFLGNSKLFSAQIRWSPKKKKNKVFTKIESDFSAEIRISKVFSAQI